MQKILVTGASGFIGERLCGHLRQQGLTVRALSRHGIRGAYEDIGFDLTRESYPPEICSDIDTIFHLAGKAHALAENRQDEDEYLRINTEATRKLLQAAKQAGVKRFIFFSSVKAVGDSDSQPMDESVTIPADTPYGSSKFQAEQLVLHGGYVPHPVVIRPCMVYGNTGKGNLPRMINAIRRNLFPPLPEFQNHRSMVHVDDVVRAALLAAEKPEASGQVYIVSDSQGYSTRQIYDWIRTALGKKPMPWAIPLTLLKLLAKTGDAIGKLRGRRFMFDSDALRKLSHSAYYSSAKIERELGFRPQHTLQQALPDIIRYLNSI